MTVAIQSLREQEVFGFVRQNSIYLPLHFELISAWVGKEMSMVAKPDRLVDFCLPQHAVGIREGKSYTNLVFRDHKDLRREFGHYKGHVILSVWEKDADIFNPEGHHYLKLGFHVDSDKVFIELIDDPFDL